MVQKRCSWTNKDDQTSVCRAYCLGNSWNETSAEDKTKSSINAGFVESSQ